MEGRFNYSDGINFSQFAFTVSLCNTIANSSTEVKEVVQKFQGSQDKARTIQSVRNLFFILLDREIGGVCALLFSALL